MTSVTLKAPCTICSSTRWCGRQCKNAPNDKASVTHDVANVSQTHEDHMANASAKAAGRNRASPTYRYRNPNKRREYMAAYMRQRRATERTARPAA